LDGIILNDYINGRNKINKDNILNHLWMDVISHIQMDIQMDKKILIKHEILFNLRFGELTDTYLLNFDGYAKVDIQKLLSLIKIIFSKKVTLYPQNIKKLIKIISNLILKKLLQNDQSTKNLLTLINETIKKQDVITILDENKQKLYKNLGFDLYEKDINKNNILYFMGDKLLFDKLYIEDVYNYKRLLGLTTELVDDFIKN